MTMDTNDMQIIKASEFKSKCLRLMNQVNETGEEIIVTKNGVPISKLVPFRAPVSSLFGLHKKQLRSQDSLIEPVGEPWDVENC